MHTNIHNSKKIALLENEVLLISKKKNLISAHLRSSKSKTLRIRNRKKMNILKNFLNSLLPKKSLNITLEAKKENLDNFIIF